MTLSPKKGFLIALEGIDGTGKSTQIKLLAKKLEEQGRLVVTTREPTDGPYGQEIRKLYVDRGKATLDEELQFFLADRKEHVDLLIQPALEKGKIVLTDRYYFSTAAYQGAAGMDPQQIVSQNELFAPRPHLVILIDLPVAESMHRIEVLRGETPNAFEQRENLEKVRTIFLELQGDYVKKVDGTKSVEDVHSSIMVYVNDLISETVR